MSELSSLQWIIRPTLMRLFVISLHKMLKKQGKRTFLQLNWRKNYDSSTQIAKDLSMSMQAAKPERDMRSIRDETLEDILGFSSTHKACCSE
jgi:hypothetical protein